MSGFLSAIATGAGLASTILGAGGDTVYLGPFEFRGMELPADMPFGGEQRMNVHKLPGGKRVIDVMGDDPTDINWSGMFFSIDALARAQQVDAIRIAGEPVMLSWRNFMYAVIVKSFTVQDKQPGYCTYSISCTVLQDMSKAAVVSPIAALEQMYADLNQAAGLVQLVASAPNAAVALQVGIAQAAVLATNMQIGSAGYAAGVSALQAAQGAASTALSAAGAALDGAVASTSAALSGLVVQTGIGATMSAVSGYVGRAANNGAIGAV